MHASTMQAPARIGTRMFDGLSLLANLVVVSPLRVVVSPFRVVVSPVCTTAAVDVKVVKSMTAFGHCRDMGMFAGMY